MATLFAEGGVELVSISATAEKLGVSRATLYRTVPTKEHLLGILFERATNELTTAAKAIVGKPGRAGDRLHELVCLQVEAAIAMRRYMPVFFGGGDLPPEVFKRWHGWSRRFEKLWVDTVRQSMDEGALTEADPVVTARLLLGMCIWVSRWYRPKERYRAEDISEAALQLIAPLATGSSA
ncbi:TetR/AcrR family transcriptional regulator [Sciscionella marina]|uniref:TetR/AcrR family transcriptional regulator n=1 Tax=Sciscionella marina TaxID=508770 RepID=UPI0023E15402|nr:TetR/AcrR family transcriptional regulator [Sciscionella marina]